MACKWPIANIPCHAPSAGKANVRFWPKADTRECTFLGNNPINTD